MAQEVDQVMAEEALRAKIEEAREAVNVSVKSLSFVLLHDVTVNKYEKLQLFHDIRKLIEVQESFWTRSQTW